MEIFLESFGCSTTFPNVILIITSKKELKCFVDIKANVKEKTLTWKMLPLN